MYVLTFVSIPTLALYHSVKGANYVVGSGSDTAAIVGGILEIIVALAGIATAVVLFPMLKKQNETFALGLVAARILESATIFVGVAFILSIVTLRQDGAGAGGARREPRAGRPLRPHLPARAELHARGLRPVAGLHAVQVAPGAASLSVIGIIGAPVLVVGYLAVLFGAIDQHGALAGLSALPVAVFEFSLGIWLIVKGFDRRLLPRLRPRANRPGVVPRMTQQESPYR